MEELLNPLVQKIEISGIRQFYNLIADIENVISFTIGQPDFETPAHIKQAAIRAIERNQTVYTHNAGMIELRQATAEFFQKKYDMNFAPSDEIIVTTGASEAIDIALRTILATGDEVILPGPIYPGYEPVIRTCGAEPIYIDTCATQFKLTAEQLTSAITDRTKCLILPYPSNPTGVSFTNTELKSLAEVLRDKPIFVLSDEIYSELTYTGVHTSISSLLPSQTIVINGLSKSHAMTGWRIGFLLAPKETCTQMLKVHQYNVTCASSISQYAALEAVTNGFHDAEIMRTTYLERRNYTYKRLKQLDLSPVLPDGAFYFFAKIPAGYQNSFTFALELVEKEKVAVVPGSAFSAIGEGYFRLSYACSMENLMEGLNRLERFLQKG